MSLTLICCFLLVNFRIINCAVITGPPQDVLISAGQDASFTCTVKVGVNNHEELTYKLGWYSGNNLKIAEDNIILIENTRYSVETKLKFQYRDKYITSILRIAEVKHPDTNVYVCFVVQKSSVQAIAQLAVKYVPEPLCMILPSSVTVTDTFTLSCMIGAGNYRTRLTWYKVPEMSDYITTGISSQTNKYFLNKTMSVGTFINGTIFRCEAMHISGPQPKETCETNPLNILVGEQASLKVEIKVLNTLPLKVGDEACFKCTVKCVSTCLGLEYAWQYTGSVQLKDIPDEKICLQDVSLSDNGNILKCVAKFGSESGKGGLVIKIDNSVLTTQTIIQQSQSVHASIESFQDNQSLQSSNVSSIYITVVVVLTILGFLAFFLYYKRKRSHAKNFGEDDKKLGMNKLSRKPGSLNNQQSQNMDVSAMYAKVNKANNLEKPSNVQLHMKFEEPATIEHNIMYESVDTYEGKDHTEEVNLYAKVEKIQSKKGGAPQVVHWKSPSGDMYACVQKSKASTLPAQPTKQSSNNTKIKSKVMAKNERSQEAKNKNQGNETVPVIFKAGNKKKQNKVKASTLASPLRKTLDETLSVDPYEGHNESVIQHEKPIVVDPDGLTYADLEFTDSDKKHTPSQTSEVIYADVKK